MAKEPKDENDPARLRWFAKRIAEMNWWGEEPKAEKPASQQPQDETTPKKPAAINRRRARTRR